jgi:hypothetical protein
MPKKKLTKAQVKRKLKTIDNIMYSFIVDKMLINSDVPISFNKLLELHKSIQSAFKRVK